MCGTKIPIEGAIRLRSHNSPLKIPIQIGDLFLHNIYSKLKSSNDSGHRLYVSVLPLSAMSTFSFNSCNRPEHL